MKHENVHIIFKKKRLLYTITDSAYSTILMKLLLLDTIKKEIWKKISVHPNTQDVRFNKLRKLNLKANHSQIKIWHKTLFHI